MKNYICINGKKTELTEEQLRQLGIEVPKANPFDRVVNHTTNDFYSYYFINSTGTVDDTVDHGFQNGNGTDDLRYRTANYCTDKTILEQRALHETLNRLLWRYSMEHYGDKIDWKNGGQTKYFIYYNHSTNIVSFDYCAVLQRFETVYFITADIAQKAIKEIVKPFMKAHPEFKW